MSQTTVPSGSDLAVRQYSSAIFTSILNTGGLKAALSGPAPTMAEVERSGKGESSRSMPIVNILDLANKPGDDIQVTLVNAMNEEPIMGDENAEGKGEKLDFAVDRFKVDLTTKVVDPGGVMAQKRSQFDLLKLAKAQLPGYFKRLFWQESLVHMAGARGSQYDRRWILPTDAGRLSPILVNPLRAPTYNRHYVVDGNYLVQGAQQLGSVESADGLKLTHLDQIRTIIDDSPYTLPPVQIPGDVTAEDDPMWVMLCSGRAYNSLLVEASGIRSWQANAAQREIASNRHPLFRGDVGMWNGILVKKISEAIRFLPSETVKAIEAANRYTGTETNVTVNGSLTPGYAVERCIILGGQALAHIYGRDEGGELPFRLLQNPRNFKRSVEMAGDMCSALGKLRFKYKDGAGLEELTDHGIIVVDVVVKL